MVVVCFAVLAFDVLSPWQFSRNKEQVEQNAAIERSFTIAPQPLRKLVAPGAAPTADLEWRQVQLTGHYLPGAEMVARMRTVQGEPAYEVLVPLRLTDGSAVLVDRGYLRPAEGAQVPGYPPPPSGEVTVAGRLRLDEPDPRHREVVVQDGQRQVYEVNSHTVDAATGVRLESGYVQLSDNTPGVLSALPLPQLDSGPFFSYALQWIVFGTMAPLGLGYFIWQELTEGRRKEWIRDWRNRRRDPNDPHDPPDTNDPHDPPEPHGPPQPQTALADRYGRTV